MEVDVERAEMEVYFEIKGVEVEGVHFDVKGRRLRRCSLRAKEWRWRLRGAVWD